MDNFRKTETTPGPLDWLLLASIVALGGSSFAMIEIAVETIPPLAVTVGRLWIGAIFLYVVMRQAGRRLPAFFDKESKRISISAEWRWLIAVAIMGYVIPFSIFPWAQQYIESGLAGIYMAFMPIWTISLAFFFAGEKLTIRKLIGFALGFIGVIILMGPEVLGDAANTSLIAQAGLLLATFGYGVCAVITRRAPSMRPRAFAAGALLASAVLTTPLLLFVDLKMDGWAPESIVSVFGLGVGPTGLAGVILIMMIQRVGAGFMSLANYVTPIWAVLLGALLFGERLEPSAFVALAVILFGVAISQSRTTERRPQTKRVKPKARHLEL